MSSTVTCFFIIKSTKWALTLLDATLSKFWSMFKYIFLVIWEIVASLFLRKLRISISQLDILHPTVFSPSPSKTKPPTLFSLKTPTAYKPPNPASCDLLPVGRMRMQSLAQGCPRSSTDLARRRTGPTRLIPQNKRGKGAPSSVGSRLLPKKFSAAWGVLVGEQTTNTAAEKFLDQANILYL